MFFLENTRKCWLSHKTFGEAKPSFRVTKMDHYANPYVAGVTQQKLSIWNTYLIKQYGLIPAV